MARDVPLRRSLLVRLLVLAATVSVGSVVATAWLVNRTTTVAIQQAQGQALTDDARIYDELLGYAATQHDWRGAAQTVNRLARDTGRRITITTPQREPILDSGAGAPPAKASATIDPLALDAALAPTDALDRIDPRAVGPFNLPGAERTRLRAAAQAVVTCLHDRFGYGASIIDQPSGRPLVRMPNTELSMRQVCITQRSALRELTPTEAAALGGLNELVNECLALRRLPPVDLNLDHTWTSREIPPSGRTGASRRSAPPYSDTDPHVTGCITDSRREQLTPYTAPAALLFVSAPGARGHAGYDLSPASRNRIAAVIGLVVLLTVAVTVLAGVRLVRPLNALTRAAQRMRDGDGSARVDVNGGDEIARLAVVFNDMSAHLEHLEELRRELVGDVAHEMRTPVSNIRGWLEAAEDGVVPVDPSLVSLLLEEAMLLQHVINDLQDLAAADAGELRLHPQPIGLSELIAQVAGTHQARADSAGVALTTGADEDLVLVADPVRLRQAVANLVANAIRHTPAGGTVALGARTEQEQVVISVGDTGSGISAENLPRVFDRFWRGEKSRNRHTGGSGLGLAIVRKIAEAHGGCAEATSIPGVGSVFTVRLPHGLPDLSLVGQGGCPES
ncbi:sensor histidine kinase [Catellatospora citrea]|uniref:Sensor-like histidine kinase SenX3 n=1 Tax=Catellatospora citrea TaxID=53366 RepID=A0A8J3KH74_9ACTN|nr:HAMP domain-containing sensor histidine kinase [Catellatospora citrea]RKE10632.1 two-component system sensor histidine kinase BaeS [Catellatospora citrea]GIG02918.1 two-component sensor histidine kinase [Catellatospora citrea]